MSPFVASVLPSAATELVVGLGKTLISALSPLAQDKIRREAERHTSPEIAAQVAQAAVSGAMRATGLEDPIAATAAARTQPEKLQAIERDVLAELERLAPIVDRMAEITRQAYEDDEVSRSAAAARAAQYGRPMDGFLTRAAVYGLYGVLLGGAALTAWLAWHDKPVDVLLGALLPIVGLVGATFRTRYEYDYGSSRGSETKQATLDEVMRRTKP